MTRTHIAKITRGNGKRNPLTVGTRNREVGLEVVDQLRQKPRPVDRIDRAYSVLRLEPQIVAHCLDDILAIVEHAADGNVVDIWIAQRKHLRGLKGAHLLIRRKHEYAD